MKHKKRTYPLRLIRNNEAYCLKCRVPRIPKNDSAITVDLPNKSVRMKARCSICNSKINRVIKAADWSDSHPLYAYLKDAPKQHNRAHDSPPECNLEEGEQYCLNITP